MEDWITSDRGTAPKTWQKLVSVLREVEELSSSTVASIEECLLIEGLATVKENRIMMQLYCIDIIAIATL